MMLEQLPEGARFETLDRVIHQRGRVLRVTPCAVAVRIEGESRVVRFGDREFIARGDTVTTWAGSTDVRRIAEE